MTLEGSSPRAMGRHMSITAAAVLFSLTAVGGTVGVAPFVVYLAVTRTAPIVFGIQVLDGTSAIGALFGIDGAIVFGFLFVAVNAVGFPVSRWLWSSLKKGPKSGSLAPSSASSSASGSAFPFGLSSVPSKHFCSSGVGGR